MQVTIQANVLKAVALFAATADARSYLKGLYLEASDKGTFLIGADGAAIAVARISAEAMPAAEIILPGAFISNLLKLKQSAYAFEFSDGARDTERLRTVTEAGSGMHAAEIDGRYPDWRRACAPASHRDSHEYFDPKYVALVQKAGETLNGTRKRQSVYLIKPSACTAAPAALSDEVCVWVCPRRVDTDDLPNGPVWL